MNTATTSQELFTPAAPAVGPTQVDLRELGINPNHWYVLALSSELKDKPQGVTLWKQNIVLFRDRTGKAHALEDRCPHRQVKLSEGTVNGDTLVCAYHGWAFNAQGGCADVPYLEPNQKLPTCAIRVYPVREQDGFVWVFPGDPALLDAQPIEPLSLPEWDHLNFIATVSVIDVKAHYSFLIENLMDMYHGHLHQDYQAWTQPVLQTLEASEQRVDAHYQAQSYYRIDKIWSISQLFIPALRKLHPEPLDVSYVYPNWVATLGEDFKICCLFCPIDTTRTRAYLIHFTSLQAFPNLHKQPLWFRRWLKKSLFGSAQKMLDGLVEQDIVMLEQEQQAYSDNPHRKGPEFNRALMSVQKLIRQQAAQS
ncbi:MAG TPA: aromatic ring-hydroxylating dioxygenase subunit alpha [Leptolyngbyaceae cyanobacterium]